MFDKVKFKETVETILKVDYGKTIENAEEYEKYNSVSKAIMEQIADNWNGTEKLYSKGKQAYYFSAEYLIGRALGNNLLNLGIYEEVEDTLKMIGM